ncbi:MAG: LysM peptidoglycan-binding domain-containing protein [Kiritimatiellae bacterium]|nr:LysM peptidoglycan-binding domain-containing protein [Kiritimatiellia bacterium]
MTRFLLFLIISTLALPVVAQRNASNAATQYALAQQAQTLREIQYTLQSLSAKVEVIEQQQAALSNRLATLERGGDSVTKDEMAALRADFNALKADQSKMRGEIINDLSAKITTIANKQRAAAEKQAAAQQKSGYNHVVEAGQTLSAIAQAYKVSVKSIMKANKITDPTRIRIGQELFIPDP